MHCWTATALFGAHVCDDCEQRVRARYRPEILNRSYNANDVDEAIWERNEMNMTKQQQAGHKAAKGKREIE